VFSFFTSSRWLLVPVLLTWCAVGYGTEFSSADYDLYAGDFNGDGKSDLLYVAKSPDKPSGIALADATGTPQMGFQSWPSNFLNIPWSNGSYKAVVGDFNGDGCSDILLQAQTPGTSYLLLANCNPANGPVGQIQGISQAIGENTFGIAWSADQHHLVAGDFDGDGKTDLLLQATSSAGTDAIVLADTNGNLFTRSSGNCWAGGPQQCWTDGYEGIKWSTQSSLIYTGDFNGDGKTDLLVQAKPTWVMINYDVPFPVPKFAAQAFGIFLAQVPDSNGAIIRTPNQLWSVNDLNGKWSPLNSTVVVGDFNGDGYADVMLQSASGTNMLMLGSSTGQLSAGTAMSGAAASWTSSAYKAIVGKFGGSSVPVLYLQATTAAGTNYITGNVSGASVTATASAMQIAATATLPATGVGATVGSANVTSGGTGTYTIPLKLPRGHAGLTPELAFQYQHSGKNGLLGVGWGISGLSVITRCPQTIAQDGTTQGVQYVASDQYCLDGNRLRLTSGNQGEDGSQYRTELETYALITAHGAGTNGPIWFQVKKKDGEIYEYGNTTDSEVFGTGGTRVWALNAIRDRASNFITFSYFNDSKNPVQACQETSSLGSYRPCQVVYSGNANEDTNPPYTLQFTYQSPRNPGEVLQHMYFGQSITEVNRLTSVQLLYAGGVVRQWSLGYDTTVTPSHLSRLVSVRECGLNSDCFPATTFTWSNQQTSNGLPAVSGPQVTDYGYALTGVGGTALCFQPWSLDIDGDGVPDTLFDSCDFTAHNIGNVTLYLGTGKGGTSRAPVTFANGTSTTSTTIDLSNWQPIGVIDLDGDGKQDFLFFDVPEQEFWWIHQPAGSSAIVMEAVPQQFSWASGILGGVLADVDGDGFPDILYAKSTDSTHIYVTYHNRDGSPGFESTSEVAWTAPTGTTILPSQFFVGPQMSMGSQTVLTAMDVDGDGRQDALVLTNNGWTVLYSNGSGFTTGDQVPQDTIAIDLNGDGCTDMVFPATPASGGTTATWHIMMSKCGVVGGLGLNPATDSGIPAPWNPIGRAANASLTTGLTVNVVDLNGDGYQDLVYIDPTTNTTKVAYSTGTGLAPAAQISSTAATVWSDRDGDGLPDQVTEMVSSLGYAGEYQSAIGPKADLMISAKDGFNNTVNYTYSPINNPAVYTRGSGTAGKTQDLDGSMYVVAQLQSTDGVGGNFSLSYTYANAHRNVQGRGFLGFGSRIITDSRTGFVTQETYNNIINSDGSAWELVGTLGESKLQQWAGGPVLQDTVNQWESMAPDNASNRRYPYLQSKTVTSYELGNTGAAITTKVTSTTIDNYGTPYHVVVTTTEDSTGLYPGSSQTQDTYSDPTMVVNDTTNWCLSKPQSTTITGSHTLTDGAAVVKSVTQLWDAANCRLTDRNLDVGTTWELDVHYDYDAWNNVWHQIVKGPTLQQSQRETVFDYSTSATPGQLLMHVYNALNQSTSYTWDNSRALKSTETDPNGFTTSWFYDDFGRFAHQLRPDGTGSRRTYSVCNASTNYCGDSLLRYMVQEDSRDTHDNIINYEYKFYDSLNRIKYAESLGYSGALSVVETLYDPRGNTASQSMPYYAGTDAYKGTSFTYDLYNRLIGTEQPTSDSDSTPATTATVYNGLTVTLVDALSNSSTRVSDAWGDILQVVDQGGNTTTYTHDGFSNLKSTTDAEQNKSTYTYNDRGFRVGSSDPDTGAWIYTYDGAGEMLTKQDAKNQLTQYHYDALGRMDNRTDPGATSPDSGWQWDSAPNGIGKLGVVVGTSGYYESYSYDGVAGRKIGEIVSANGGTYSVNYNYDPVLGTLQTIAYPTTASGSLEVMYDYQNGYLKDVKDYNNQSTVFWQAIAQDARGHVIQEQLGNGQQSYLDFDETNGRLNAVQTGPGGGTASQNLSYSWDKVGNLLSRQDENQGLAEGFQFDSLYRLQTVTLNGAQTLAVSYDAIGNMSSKSDLSSGGGGASSGYNYTAAQATCNYSGLTAQPHAVRNAAGTVYCYDADGNMITRNGAAVSWYPYNLPQTINQPGGNYNTFYYTPDRDRYRQTSTNASVIEDRIYIAGLFEQMTSSSVGTEYRNYIVANGVKVAIKVLSSTRNDTLYLHGDHLGSTDVITDQTGAIKLHESYDAWGNRRGSNWTGAPSSSDVSTITTTTHIGYTAQEHLDNLSLIDLNGRVYDPVIARFMSADPYVQAPYASQSLNRYSYTWNNPLNQTDPTGFCSTGTNIAGSDGTSAACAFTGSTDPSQGAQMEIGGNPSQAAATAKAPVNPESTSNTAQVTSNSLPEAQQAAATTPHWQIVVGAQRPDLSINDYLSLLNHGYYERPGSQPLWGGMTLVGPGAPTEKHSIYSDSGAMQAYQDLMDLLGTLGTVATMIPMLPEAGVAGAVDAAVEAVEPAGDLAREIGILRDAARGKGNFGLGSGSPADAERLGRAWVGDGYEVASDGKTMISNDGLRQFRPPSFKPNLGIKQANFEQRLIPGGRWFGNGHLDITEP
jgi:RHS repeat-associated protein